MLIDGTQRKEQEGGENTTLGGTGQQSVTLSSGGGQTATQPNQAQKPSSSGSWTNLKSYIQNPNNATVNRIQQTGQNKLQSAQGAISQAQNVGQSAQKELSGIRENQQFAQNIFQDPTKASQEDINRFTNLRTSAQFDPSKPVSQFQETANQARQTQGQTAQTLQGLQTQGGISDYIRSIRQSPRFTQGSMALDKFLTTATDQGRQATQNLAQQGRALGERQDIQTLESQIGDMYGQIDPNLLAAQQFQNLANQRKQGFVSELEPNITEQRARQNIARNIFGENADQDIANAQQAQKLVNQKLDFDQINQSLLAIDRDLANLSRTAPQNLDTLYKQYTTQIAQPLRAEQALTADEIARLNALAQLSGQDVSDFLARTIGGQLQAPPTTAIGTGINSNNIINRGGAMGV